MLHHHKIVQILVGFQKGGAPIGTLPPSPPPTTNNYLYLAGCLLLQTQWHQKLACCCQWQQDTLSGQHHLLGHCMKGFGKPLSDLDEKNWHEIKLRNLYLLVVGILTRKAIAKDLSHYLRKICLLYYHFRLLKSYSTAWNIECMHVPFLHLVIRTHLHNLA